MTCPADDGTGDALHASAISDIRNAHGHLHEWLEDPEHRPSHLSAAVRHVALAMAAMGDGSLAANLPGFSDEGETL